MWKCAHFREIYWFHLFSKNRVPFKHRTLTIHIGYFNEQFVSPTSLSFIHRTNFVKLNRYLFGTQCKNMREIPIPLFFLIILALLASKFDHMLDIVMNSLSLQILLNCWRKLFKKLKVFCTICVHTPGVFTSTWNDAWQKSCFSLWKIVFLTVTKSV